MHANLVYQIDVQKWRPGWQSKIGCKVFSVAALRGRRRRRRVSAVIEFGALQSLPWCIFGAILYIRSLRFTAAAQKKSRRYNPAAWSSAY